MGAKTDSFEMVISSTDIVLDTDDPDDKIYHLLTPSDQHPIYALIGRVAAEWSHLEHTLDNIVWTLSGTISPRSACITAQLMGVAPRIRAIIALLHLRDAADPGFKNYITKMNSLQQNCYGPQEHRNRIIHDVWYIDSKHNDNPAQYRTWPSKDLQFGIRDVDVTSIETTIADIKKLSTRAASLYNEINRDVAACLRKRREERAAIPHD